MHYCVANMPGAVPAHGDGGADGGDAAVRAEDRAARPARRLLTDPALAKGVLVSEGNVTYEALAESLGLPCVPLSQALPPD